MGDVVRIVLSCRDRRQAFHLGAALLRDRLAATMSVGSFAECEPSHAGTRATTVTPLVLLTYARILPILEAKVLELHPKEPPRLVGVLQASPAPGIASYVRSRVAVPTLH